MPAAETLRVALEVVRALDRLGIPYMVGGSLASSFHGIPRATQDADIVAGLREDRVDLLGRAWQEAGLNPEAPPGAGRSGPGEGRRAGS